MQRSLRFNENQYIYLANKAKNDFALCAHLWKKSRESLRWQQKYFVLYQNFLFYYENDSSVKPMGCFLLEGSYCEHVIPSAKTTPDRQFMFSVSFRGEGGRQIELACDNQEQCDTWVGAVQKSSFNLLRMHKEELEKKHQHILQILETERGTRNQYMNQCEEQAEEIAKLRTEHLSLKQQIQKLKADQSRGEILTEEETEELKKIKKVQSLMRGWLCRRRWLSIVAEYIKSPHAEMMRSRNRLVFAMVADEEDYVDKLSILVSVFYRTLKMAASSKKPLITHEDVNSIFLNCETILFLHQIFSKGLNARLEAWPRLILGDLFDMLLPMLSIYQEYVRNHHYSLQVLAECKQRSCEFGTFIERYEEKPVCKGRTIEHYLTVPMWQIPRYIQSLCHILAHTPHDHVERKSLQYAKHQLENLSLIMRDEVSETENIRRNLAIERQIVEGCDILLDVQQIFVRQGTMLQACLESKPIVSSDSNLSTSSSQSLNSGGLLGGPKPSSTGTVFAQGASTVANYLYSSGLNSVGGASSASILNSSGSGSSFSTLTKKRSNPGVMFGVGSNSGSSSGIGSGNSSSGSGKEDTVVASCSVTSMDKKETVKQCFLFSNHLIVTSRSSSGKLHLNKLVGKISLANATLLDDEILGTPVNSSTGGSSLAPVKEVANSEYEGRYFKLVVSHQGYSYLFLFVAPTNQEKEAWVTDIGQCIENIHISGLLTGQVRFEESGSIRMLQSVRSDPSLFQDDPQIKFSRGTNSCRVPQIRYATVEKLLDRLIDVRFLSIEFLNTFLMTYRYFTTAERVMNVLRQSLLNPSSTDFTPSTATSPLTPTNNSLDSSDNQPSQFNNGSQGVSSNAAATHKLSNAGAMVPQTPSPVEQMVGNPSTYRIRKNTAPAIVNSINNQSADAIKRRMAQPRNSRNMSEAAIAFGTHPNNNPVNKLHNSPTRPSVGNSNQFYTTACSQCCPANFTDVNRANSKSSSGVSLSGPIGDDLSLGSPVNSPCCNALKDVDASTAASCQCPVITTSDGSKVVRHNHSSTSGSPDKTTFSQHSTTEQQQQNFVNCSSPTCAMSDYVSGNGSVNNSSTASTVGGGSSTGVVNSGSGGGLSNSFRASLNSIGEFVTSQRKHHHLSTTKQFSVESDDSSFVVYSIKDSSDNDSLGNNQKRLSLESIDTMEDGGVSGVGLEKKEEKEKEKNIIDKVKEAAFKISESSFNNNIVTTTTNNNNNNNHQHHHHHHHNNSNNTSNFIPSFQLHNSCHNNHQLSDSSSSFDKSITPAIYNPPPILTCSSSGNGAGSITNGKRFSLDSYLYTRNDSSSSNSNSHKKAFSPGVVVTSSRKSTRRSSLQTAAAAFAAATAGATSSSNSLSSSLTSSTSLNSHISSGGVPATNRQSTTRRLVSGTGTATGGSNSISSPPNSTSNSQSNSLFSKSSKSDIGKRCSDLSSATSMRVLHVLRHWSTKFPEDFEEGEPANELLISMLKEAQSNNCLTVEEEKIVNGIYRALTNYEQSKDEFVSLLSEFKSDATNQSSPAYVDEHSYPPITPVAHSSPPTNANGLVLCLDNMAALDVAENLTFIQYKVFSAIPFWEFFNQAWVKEDKHEKAPRILLTTKRFNDVSTLVATTILREPTEKGRAAVIEKWAGVADVCKGLRNFNSVLEIISAFGRTPVYRLRKTWERVSKQTRSIIDKLQTLVSTDGHFKNLRDALHKCDPPALPYLGMYLTDLTFIEDGTPMVTSDGLINFSRMRMISNVVQEIRLYQQTPYPNTNLKEGIIQWLLQPGHVWTEEQMYNRSLALEPRPNTGAATTPSSGNTHSASNQHRASTTSATSHHQL